MPVAKSVYAFKNEKLNCAQAILKAFSAYIEVKESDIAAFKKMGGGRAEEGMCGALYGALHLCGTSETKEQLRKEFAEKAGSENCKVIKREKLTTCDQCVEIAAAALQRVENIAN